MAVRLISYTKPAEFFSQDVENVQDLVAYCARVSNPSNQNNKETNEKLIKYLIKHQHWSPLEMVNACLEINTTRDIAHQIVRHRSFSFQEFSQRYANPEEMGDMFVHREARMQDKKNRQNSVDLDEDNIEDMRLAMIWSSYQNKVIQEAKEAYKWAIENGIAKEQARVVLPEGLTKTRLYMNGSLRSWVHYIDLRGGHGTQKEHMEIAWACAKVIAEIFPMVDDLGELSS
jgi:thymidylate synthase (FAD)